MCDPLCHDISIGDIFDNSESESQKIQSREIFSFKSDFPEDDIEKQLDEVLKNTNVTSIKILLKDQLTEN